MRRLFLALLPLALAACATTRDAPIVENGPALPGRSAVALGQPVQAGALVATPTDVTEDSRCPVEVQCVWAGRVVITARIDGAGWRETVPLTLGTADALHGTTITLISVTPAKKAGQAIAPADYRFTFAGGT
jgi:hypothetical protein